MSSFETKKIGRSRVQSKGYRRKKKTPTKLKYALVGGALLIALIFFNFFQTLRRASAFQEFKVNTFSRNYTEALVQLESFDNVFSNKYSKFNARNSQVLPTATDRKDFIVGLIKALNDLESDNYFPALKNLKAMQKDLTRLTSGFNNNRSRFHQDYNKYLGKLIKEFKIFRRKELKTPYLIQNNKRRIYQQSILSQDLANEFGGLMSLAPIVPRNPSQSIQFYKKGILQGLPKLKKLPDDITDLLQLKKELTLAGGQVRIKGGANTPDLFLKQIQELKGKCSVFEEQITNLDKENMDMKDSLEIARKNFDKDLLSAKQIFNNFIIDYVTPKSDSWL